MALEYIMGICTNMEHENGKPCPLCAKKERQRVLSNRDFVCRVCGKPLTKVMDMKPASTGIPGWLKYVAIGVGAVIVLSGVAVGAYFLLSGPSKPKEITLNHMQKTLMVGEKDTLRAVLAPKDSEGTLIWKASSDGCLEVEDGIVTAISEGTSKVQVTVKDVDGIEAVCNYTVNAKEEEPVDVLDPTDVQDIIDGKAEPINKPEVKERHVRPIDYSKVTSEKKKDKPQQKTNTSAANVGYGHFSGPVKNKLPNGRGTLKYKTTHLIDSRDPKGRVAEPGDYVIGEWKNGKLIQGVWYGPDNNSKGAIIIGM